MPPICGDCSQARKDFLKTRICQIVERIQSCCAVLSQVEAINLNTELNAYQAELALCSGIAIETQYFINPLTGESVIGYIDETNPSGGFTFINIDGTPYIGPTPVNASRDREFQEFCRTITVAGAWGNIDDEISVTNVYDISGDTRILVETFYFNKTQNIVAVGVDNTNSVLCKPEAPYSPAGEVCYDDGLGNIKNAIRMIQSSGGVFNIQFIDSITGVIVPSASIVACPEVYVTSVKNCVV